MKKIIVLLLLPFLGFTQNDTIKDVKSKLSVIGLDRMNVVYRGVPNPISIAVNDAKSYTITGNGVSQNEEGKYVLRPGPGTETKVIVEIEKLDGSKVVEEHTFRIKVLPKGIGCIDGYYCIGNCYLEFKIKEIEGKVISAERPDFLFPYELPSIKSFTILSFENKKLVINGNTFDKKSIDFILKNVDKNGEILLVDIKPDFNYDLCFPPSYMMKIRIIK